MAKFIVSNCMFTLAEDSYAHGQDPKEKTWDEEVPGEANSIREALAEVPHLDCDYFGHGANFENDPCMEDEHSRFDNDCLVVLDCHGNIFKPSETEFEEWKKGNIKLHNLHVSVWIKKTSDLAEEDVKEYIDGK